MTQSQTQSKINSSKTKTQRSKRIMEKKTLGGVQKKRPIRIRRSKKKLLSKVIDYLISDTYMFAPLISHPPHAQGFSSRASVAGVEVRKGIKGNNKRLVNKVGDYLKEDSYMYAPLLIAPSPSTSTTNITTSPSKAPSRYLQSVSAIAVTMKNSISKDKKSSEQIANVIVENQASKRYLPENGISEQQSVQHKETVKHVVRHSCRSSSMLGHHF